MTELGDLCPGMYTTGGMPISISVTKCSFASHKLCLDFWQEIRRIKVIKCPPNSSLQGDINSNPNPNLKDKLNTNANPKVTTRWLTLILDLGDIFKLSMHLIMCISGHH